MSGDPYCPKHGMFPCFCFYNTLSGHNIGETEGKTFDLPPAPTKLDAKQLRNIPEEECPQLDKRNPIYFIADNIYDTFNCGGLFRLCDALAASHFYICGNSPVPPNPKIKSSSSGTYKCVPWSYHESTVEAISLARQKDPNHIVYALEQPREGFEALYRGSFTKELAKGPHRGEYDHGDEAYYDNVIIVVGCETGGIRDGVLEVVDGIIDIPMWGINKSLNVIVAASIVGYEVARRWGF